MFSVRRGNLNVCYKYLEGFLFGGLFYFHVWNGKGTDVDEVVLRVRYDQLLELQVLLGGKLRPTGVESRLGSFFLTVEFRVLFCHLSNRQRLLFLFSENKTVRQFAAAIERGEKK